MTDESGRRREPPTSLRVPAPVLAWYEARAARRGTTPHAEMIEALTRAATEEGEAA